MVLNVKQQYPVHKVVLRNFTLLTLACHSEEESKYLRACQNHTKKTWIASTKRPVCDTGAFRNYTFSCSLMSVRHSQRWRSWTTSVDIARPRDCAVTFVGSQQIPIWSSDVTSPFPPSGNEGYIRNRDVSAPQNSNAPTMCLNTPRFQTITPMSAKICAKAFAI